MKKLILAVLAASFTASGTVAAEIDCRAADTREFLFCKDDKTLVEAYYATLLASADGALKEGLRNRIPRIEFSIAEQASSIRQLILEGRLSASTLALIDDVDDAPSMVSFQTK